MVQRRLVSPPHQPTHPHRPGRHALRSPRPTLASPLALTLRTYNPDRRAAPVAQGGVRGALRPFPERLGNHLPRRKAPLVVPRLGGVAAFAKNHRRLASQATFRPRLHPNLRRLKPPYFPPVR